MITPACDAIDLRRGIDYIGVTVCCVIHDGKGNRMLMKRGEQARDERGTWDNTGGALEFGESFEEAIARELNEELCTEPKHIEYLATFDVHRTNDDGRPTHWVAVAYAVRVDPSSVKNGEPHKIAELGWFTSQTMPAPLHSQLMKTHDIAQQRGIII